MRKIPYRKAVEAELYATLEMGVIEKSHIRWCSAIVLVSKTDGTLQFCVDYRGMNEVAQFDPMPLAI